MTLAMGPLIVLYELSILLALWLDRVRPPVSRFDWEDDDAEDAEDAEEFDFGQDVTNGSDASSRDRPEE
jgi:hypothetical protein